ncbi:MAG: BMP family ABC transporter substrate-binding protein [Bacilli bacterium]|nr:BMP family ABC transporter substrate-binding protein [Bacilli bacterium]
MRKAFAAVFVAALAATLASCGKQTFEIALVTDVGTINDKSFNQGAWEGTKKYAEEKKISYKYYQPRSASTDDYIATAETAINNGAKVVVTPGFLFENAVWKLQTSHPEVKFILLDGSPHNVTDWDTNATLDGGAPNFDVKKNVYPIFYAEEEAGFYAGYAAVHEGMRKLGFMGGMAVPAVVRFGLGYIEGAKYAANELALGVNAVEMSYSYLGDFGPSEGHQTKAKSWYDTGTEVIFAAAGGAGNSVMAAASDSTDKWVIGVDVDQSSQSDRVLTSAMKELGNSVYQTLEGIYAETPVEGGTASLLDSKVDGVGLPEDFSRFQNFTKAQYDAIYAKVVAGQVTIEKGVDAPDYVGLGGTKVKVTVIE